MVGTGHGAKNGVLIKKAEALETLEKVDAIVVDKTGTLTEGKPTVQRILTFAELNENQILALAASVERHSVHPLAMAVVAAAASRNLELFKVTNFKSTTGVGVEGTVDSQRVEVSRLADKSLAPEDASTSVFVTIDTRLVGGFSIVDAVKPSARAAVDGLHRDRVRVVMMTGDNQATATAVSKQLGIDQVFAEVMPEDKVSKVQELQSQGKIVAMAGDGVNDAPALAQADIGIAFASGTDVAIESADITLLRPDLDGILKARNLSQATMRNIRQNLFFAFIYNIVGVPIAAGVLFPVFGLLLSPMIASAAMTFSSVSVIMNALRLRNVKI